MISRRWYEHSIYGAHAHEKDSFSNFENVKYWFGGLESKRKQDKHEAIIESNQARVGQAAMEKQSSSRKVLLLGSDETLEEEVQK